ncbi:spore gernimation protein GerPD [Cohnella nanjingensis]|uniref:Spore gernimation protein GerPD n=1 Tax=Cohnella nanjingensis TaxID=1387779 RepID=A0A7X0RTT7_9BACL|nr:spore gernimation protein GerPD [Cohnella nanjingensis]MBB6673401.1 spore gernimation protein GerPD [Cohnella nanjingensis]
MFPSRQPVQLNVTNGPVAIGSIRIIGVSSSASFLIGDTESLTLSSFFDTPPESVIVGPLAPMPSLPDEELEQGL